MLRKKILIWGLLSVMVSACHQTTDSEKIADQQNSQKADRDTSIRQIEPDTKFVVKATSGVTMETELGSYAAKHAATPDVKKFGQTMVTDHAKDKAALTSLAAAKHITIPPRTGSDFQKHIDEITAKKGLAFDKAYISFMVGDHKEDISEFEKEASDGKDPEIKAFAAKSVPTLQHHLQMAANLNDQLK